MLWKSDARRGQVVAACNRGAGERGIRPGMPRGEADTLLHSLDARHRFVQRWEPAADLRMLEQFAAIASARFSPLVALEPLQPEPWSGQLFHEPQALLLEITHLDKLFGSEQKILWHIQQWLASWDVRGAIADSVGAAWAVAHFATTRQPFRIVKPGCNQQALAPLPPAALRLPQEAAHNLQRLGIESTGDLLRLPRDGLATRFGKAFLLRIDQALGHVGEPLPIHHETGEDSSAIDLEYPTRDSAILKDRIERLIAELCTALAKRRAGALRLVCRFDFVNRAALHFELGLFAPTADRSHLTRLLHGRFDNQRLSADVQRLLITVPLTAPLRQYQGNLLSAMAADGPTTNENAFRTELARLIDGVSGRLGSERVLGVSRENDPLPENAYCLTPLADHRQTGQRQAGQRRFRGPAAADAKRSSAKRMNRPQEASQDVTVSQARDRFPSPNSPLRRPLALLPQPLAMDSFDPDAEGIPRRLRLTKTGTSWRVVRYWGPERIESNWWRGPSIRRDYYRIETDSSQWLWVFRLLSENRWMLHGWFS